MSKIELINLLVNKKYDDLKDIIQKVCIDHTHQNECILRDYTKARKELIKKPVFRLLDVFHSDTETVYSLLESCPGGLNITQQEIDMVRQNVENSNFSITSYNNILYIRVHEILDHIIHWKWLILPNNLLHSKKKFITYNGERVFQMIYINEFLFNLILQLMNMSYFKLLPKEIRALIFIEIFDIEYIGDGIYYNIKEFLIQIIIDNWLTTFHRPPNYLEARKNFDLLSARYLLTLYKNVDFEYIFL